MSMRLLVTGANGDIAESIGRILKELYPDAAIDGADCNGAMPGALLFDRMHPLPVASSPDYAAVFHDLAQRYDRVIPMPEPELIAIAAQSDAWRASLPLVINAPWVITTFCDKLETARWLARCGDACARTVRLEAVTASDLPIVAKPRAGWGSRGVEIVRTPERLAALRAEVTGEWIAQEFLDAAGEEHTCAIVRAGSAVNTIAMRRTMQGGLTRQATVVDNPAIDRLLQAIAAELPELAFINVQLRIAHGVPRVFEINPRLSSTVMMRHLMGFRDVQWILDAMAGKPLQPAKIHAGASVIRMSREVVLSP
jgi:carbamoyl-phosphate synthase large subunit